MDPRLADEIAAQRADGVEFLTVKQLDERFRELGYRLDRRMDCHCNAQTMTGPRAGTSYPAITTGVVEVDTGMRAFHVDARRDANYRAMQKLRGEVAAIVNGSILSV